MKHSRHVVAAFGGAVLLAGLSAWALEVRLTPRGLEIPELGASLEMMLPQAHSKLNAGICPTKDGFQTMKDGEMPYRLCEITGHSWTYPMGDGRLSAHVAGGVLHVTNVVTFSADGNLACAMFRFRLPRAELENGRWRIDARQGTWAGLEKPVETKAGELSFDLPARGRTLTFAFPEPVIVRLQDDRKNKMDAMSVWFGDPRARVRATGETWRCAFTLAADVPVAFSAAKRLVVGTDRSWVPLTYRKDIVAGSALDFSGQGMSDAPAGKYGWLKSRGGHFVFERRPDAFQRFYGVNLCGSANMPPKDVSDILVTRLVRLGYNSVRVHHYDGWIGWRKKPGHVFDPEMMDRFDYLMARAFAAGIYVTTDLYVSREVTWRDLGAREGGPIPKQALKGLFMLTDAGFDNWAAFSRDFLEHVNPYTGRAYKDEPGLPLISLINENPLSMGWHDLRTFQVTAKLWKKRFGTDDCARVEESDPRLATFSAEAEERFCTKAKALFASIGAKALVTDLNCGGCDPAGRAVRARLFDYADLHFYVDHPQFPVGWWKMPAYVGAENPLRTPVFRPLMMKKWSLGEHPMPFVSSEWNFVGPGRFRGVGGIATGGAAALEDWSGAWRFSYTYADVGILDGKGMVDWFNLASDPLQQATERAALCLFLRGDLAAGDTNGFRIDSSRGTLVIDTPRTCGGFVESGQIAAGPLKADVGAAPATVWVSSLDGSDVTRSRHLVLTHLTDVQSTGTTFGDDTRSLLLSWGKAPPMMRDGTADVSLALDRPEAYDVFALGADGTRLDAVPTRAAGGRLAFTASVRGPDDKARMFYEIVRRRIAEGPAGG